MSPLRGGVALPTHGFARLAAAVALARAIRAVRGWRLHGRAHRRDRAACGRVPGDYARLASLAPPPWRLVASADYAAKWPLKHYGVYRGLTDST
jgi:hypothetical protein